MIFKKELYSNISQGGNSISKNISQNDIETLKITVFRKLERSTNFEYSQGQ